jgi:hypothetical protein
MQGQKAGMLKLRWALGAAVATLALTATAGAASDPKYAGKNVKAGYIIHFKVVGSEVRNKVIFWRAHCQSGQALSRGTGSPALALSHGQWKGHGHYSAKLPYAAHMVGRFTVLQDDGSVSRRGASGTFHLKVSLYIRGRLSDKCNTGVIHWRAHRK